MINLCFVNHFLWVSYQLLKELFKQKKILKLGNKNFLHYISEIIRKEGILKLYSGMSSALVGSVISYGIYFFSYKFWNVFLERNKIKKA